jgi:hypothetical protein
VTFPVPLISPRIISALLVEAVVVVVADVLPSFVPIGVVFVGDEPSFVTSVVVGSVPVVAVPVPVGSETVVPVPVSTGRSVGPVTVVVVTVVPVPVYSVVVTVGSVGPVPVVVDSVGPVPVVVVTVVPVPVVAVVVAVGGETAVVVTAVDVESQMQTITLQVLHAATLSKQAEVLEILRFSIIIDVFKAVFRELSRKGSVPV